MKKFSKKIFFSVLGFILLSLVSLFWFKIGNVFLANAGASDNTSGFAWSNNLGWISFNNTSGGGANSYGVNIIDNDTTGIFSGYAWSNFGGWLTFNTADLSGCPTAPCSAVVDKRTGQVSGWGKFLTTNDWVKLRGSGYGVMIGKTTGDFSGWAWGGESGGWISFNCSQAETGSICPSANYKVHTSFDMNIKPTTTLGPDPNPVAVNLCSTPAYRFSWIFNDLDDVDSQTQYQLQVDKEGTFSVFGAGEVNITALSSVDKGVLQTKEVLLAQTPGLNQLGYNSTNYKWRVRVWDSWGGISPWANGTNFISPPHISPSPNFIWKPQIIIRDQLIQFCAIQDGGACDTNQSVCYGPGYPSCAGATFTWTLPPNSEFANSTNANTPNPVIKFKVSGTAQMVSLKVEDDAGFCTVSKNVDVTLPLPKWQEILPQ